MKIYLKVCAFAVSLLALALILTFKTLPSGKLWKEYSVMYVASDVYDSTVVSVLKANEINDFVSQNNQFLPVNFSENSPEVSMFKVSYTNNPDSYLFRRNNYFFDKSNSYRLYYIPSRYKTKLDDCISVLSAQGAKAGSDNASTYPWILPVLMVLIAGGLTFFCKNRIEFGITALLPVLFIFCNPFYPIAFALILVLLILFFIFNVWRRKGAFLYIFTNPLIIAFSVIPLICGFSVSVKTGFLFLLCIAGTAGVLITILNIQQYLESKKTFVPVFIKPARKKSLFGQNSKKITISLAASAFLIFVVFCFTSSAKLNSKFAKVQLPADKGQSAKNLPDLNEYTRFVWDLTSAPYRSLNAASSQTDVIIYPRFTKENGKVNQTFEQLVYNQDFRDKTLEEIDKLKFNSIEKVIRNQDENFTPCYASVSSFNTNLFGIIQMIISLFVLLFLLISTIIGKGIIK